MTDKPILDDLHEIRERMLAESGGTLAGLVARLQKEQQTSGRIVRKNTTNQDRDRGPVTRDPSHTTGHAGPHPAVENDF